VEAERAGWFGGPFGWAGQGSRDHHKLCSNQNRPSNHKPQPQASLFAEHLVSDHLFLGGTILICLQAEALALVSDAVRGSRGLGAAAAHGGGGAARARAGGKAGRGSPLITFKEAGLTVAFAATLVLYLCTAADM
jgi:hypothetical protein